LQKENRALQAAAASVARSDSRNASSSDVPVEMARGFNSLHGSVSFLKNTDFGQGDGTP
jgi:hypothetical protein